MYIPIIQILSTFKMIDISIESAILIIVFFLCLFFSLLIIRAYLGLIKQKHIHLLNVETYTNQYNFIKNELDARSFPSQDFHKRNNEFYEKIIDLKSSLYFLKIVLNSEN